MTTVSEHNSAEPIVVRAHALVSPSSLTRTIKCPRSLKINEDWRLEHGDESTPAAAEGTKAHAVAENCVNEAFGLPLQEDSVAEAADADSVMEYCATAYRDFILKVYQGEGCTSLATETRVDLTDYVEECWGTCDCFMTAADKIIIVDYKYGHALVRAEGNNQLRAYALGAYLSVPAMDRARIRSVEYFIFQPRATTDYTEYGPRRLAHIGAISHDTISVTELKAWAADTNVAVKHALRDEGDFCSGEHCAFCAGKGTCPATQERSTEDIQESLDSLFDNK